MPPEREKGKGKGAKREKAEGRRRKAERKTATREKVARPRRAESLRPSPFPLAPSPASVAIVGAGRLGTALGRALTAAGYKVVGVVARRLAHARRAASLVGAHTQAFAASELARLPPAQLLFIATPDDRVAETAVLLAELMQADDARRSETDKSVTTNRTTATRRASASQPRRIALHTSGALTSEALAPLRACGFGVGSMHPLISISEPLAGAESLRRAFYCTEGDAQAVRAARGIVRALGGQSFTIDTADKALYHAAAVMTSGHTVALFDLTTQLLALCGLSPARARRVLLPLLASTLDNLSTQTPARALTGSFARADLSTIRHHLDALRTRGDRAALLVYALLGERSLRLAREGGAETGALEEIARALDEILRSG